MAKKGAIFIKNDLILFQLSTPPLTLFKGKKELDFTLKEERKEERVQST